MGRMVETPEVTRPASTRRGALVIIAVPLSVDRRVITPDLSLPAESDIQCWLAIGRTASCNGRVVLRALEVLGSVGALFGAGARELAALGFSRGAVAKIHSVDWDAVGRDRDILESLGACVVPIGTGRYPSRLAAIANPPPVLYCRGDPGILDRAQLAIVGARAATRGGCEWARALACELAACGLVVTSGLARGIDAAAHRGALDAGASSVAVLATGPDRIYPQSNAGLARELVNAGAVITERAPGTLPLAENFPRRNRLISGLSIGVLVVEASLRSGSLITARFAADEGREVFAVPGPVNSPLSRGCHALIRDGAKLVESAVDVLEEFISLDELQEPPAFPEPAAGDDCTGADEDLGEPAQSVLEGVGHVPVTLDQLVDHTGLTPNRLSSILLSLELDGRIDALPGARYVRSIKGRR